MEGIAYQNKDVTSKFLAEGFKNKSLEVYGVHMPNIVEVKPTNLPVIMANELRLDNLFEFADGSYGIIDYESKFDEQDKISYLNYIARVSKRLADEGIPVEKQKIRIIILYTSNVKEVNAKLDLGSLQMEVEAGYLSIIDSEKVFQKIEKKVKNKALLDDKEMMEMIVLPLTRAAVKEQKEWLKKVIDLAKEISDESQQVFVLSGILAFSDKIIESDYAEEVRRWIQMTKVAQIFEREKEEAVKEAVSEAVDKAKRESERRETVLRMLLKGDNLINITEKTGFTEEEIKELIK